MIANRLLCFASGRVGAGDWQAICLDFDIAVHGQSFDEVKILLENAVESYIEDASREDAATRDRLLRRSAPFLVRLRYILGFVWHALRNRSGDRAECRYHIPCHI